MVNKKYITIPRLAELLGISRTEESKKVVKGQIPATKIGKNYAISSRDVARILGKEITAKDKSQIEKAVKKTVKEYGEVLRWLSKE